VNWRSPAVDAAVAVAAMALVTLITLANVIVRYFTDQSFALTEEVSVFLMVLMTMAGASAATASDRHIRIEYFYDTGSPARQRLLRLFSSLVTAVFFFALGVLFCRVVWDEYKFGDTSMGLGIPRWWYSVWIPLFCFVLCMRAVGLAMRVSRAAPGAGDTGGNAP
jgi:TRAP-type C4-dicarboxylate transport system permease small subunit